MSLFFLDPMAHKTQLGAAAAVAALLLVENARLEWGFRGAPKRAITSYIASPAYLLLHVMIYVVRCVPSTLVERLFRLLTLREAHPLGWTLQHDVLVRMLRFSTKVSSFRAVNALLELSACIAKRIVLPLHRGASSTRVAFAEGDAHDAPHAYWISRHALPPARNRHAAVRSALRSARAVVFYCHGGGYCVGNAEMYLSEHLSLSARVEALLGLGEGAASGGVGVLSVEYTLAAEGGRVASPLPARGCFPRAIADVVHAYEFLLDTGVPPTRIVVGGDSAGGGLALALLVHIRDAGLAQPAAALLVSPWVNHFPSHAPTSSYVTARHDYLLPTTVALFSAQCRGVAPGRGHIDAAQLMALSATREGAAAAAAAAAAGGPPLGIAPVSPTHPSLSPLYAELHGLAPCHVTVGGAETFRDDIEGLFQALHAASPDAGHELDAHENMVHVYPMIGLLGRCSTIGRQHMATFAARALATPANREEVRDQSRGTEGSWKIHILPTG